MPGEDAINGLREAIQVSPNNVPLRKHLAETLIGFGYLDQAELEFREALKIAPNHIEIKLGLAKVCARQNKTSQAIVIVEDICSSPDLPANAQVQAAKILADIGEIESAVTYYKLALDADPECADSELSSRLGVGEEFKESEIVDGCGRRVSEFVEGDNQFEIDRPEIKFEDVGGMENVKEEISLKILYPLKNPEIYEAYGKKIGGGILMYGPPGCGKTYLARATAGEIGAGFLSVGISDVLDMWIGKSEQNLSAIFDQARANTPCVLFFDEVDALGGRRTDMRGGAERNVINLFLSELDGVEKSNDGVLVLAATNAPWHIDPAFRRPGRFDRVLFVPPPDHDSLMEITRLQMKGKPQTEIDYRKIVKKLKGFSGADIKAVVDQAVEAKLRSALKSGTPTPIETSDLMAAAKSLRPTTKEWFSSAKNYALYSNQGGIYDDVLKYMKL